MIEILFHIWNLLHICSICVMLRNRHLTIMYGWGRGEGELGGGRSTRERGEGGLLGGDEVISALCVRLYGYKE